MTAAAARPAYLADVFEEHLDELAFLWPRWRAALRDPRYTPASVAALEERISARLAGARVPGSRAWPHLAELLAGDDADLAFSAASVLLRAGDGREEERVVSAFAAADGARFDALARALAHGPLSPSARERVRRLLAARPAARAAAAAEVLAVHGEMTLGPEDLRYFLEEDDGDVRRAGWRLVALAGAPPSSKSFARAMRDADAAVACAALEAGAWCRVPGVLAVVRQFAEAPSPERREALRLLAVLGTAEDAPRIRALVAARELGPARFRLAAASSDPALVDLLLAAMTGADPADAAAAGAAFLRMTGVDVDSGTRVTLPASDGRQRDAFDAHFADEAVLPDAERARDAWGEIHPHLPPGARLCRGLDAADPALWDDPHRLDMESRADLLLRKRFHEGIGITALALETYPQGSIASLPP